MVNGVHLPVEWFLWNEKVQLFHLASEFELLVKIASLLFSNAAGPQLSGLCQRRYFLLGYSYVMQAIYWNFF
jgi:hypothetical protein